MDWDEYFMRMAYLVARKSKDNSTKIGTVIVKDKNVVATGFNGIPAGCRDDVEIRYERPLKYEFFSHSEVNSLFQCAKLGHSSKDTQVYTLGCPCSSCARGLIQAGCKEIIIHKQWKEKAFNFFERWARSCEISLGLFRESGVAIREYDKHLNETILLSGLEIQI